MATTAKALLEKRASIYEESTKILEKAESEDRAMSAEERTQWERMHAEMDDLKSRADDLHSQETARHIADEELDDQLPGESRSEERDSRREKPPITGGDMLRAWALGDKADSRLLDRCREARVNPYAKQVDFRIERSAHWIPPRSIAEVNRRYDALAEKRAMTGLQSTTTAGGYTVPDDMMREIEVALLRFGGMRQVSTIMSTDSGAPLPIPTVNDTAQVGEIIDENTTVTDQDATFGQLVLDSWKYSSKFLKVSIELLQDSATNIPALMGRLAGERIGRIHNQHFTNGTGTGQPRGITVAAVDSTINQAVAGTLEWDTEMLELKHSVDPAYRQNATWMMDDAQYLNAKQMQDSQGRPLWLPNLVAGAPDRIDGDPVVINQDMPTGTGANGIIYGDLSKYIIRDVLNPGFSVLRLDERFAELGTVAFLVYNRADGDLLDAGTGPVKFMDLA